MFDWDTYLDLAERLAHDVGDEAAHLTAVSRAYYAAYHAAARFVRESGLVRTRHTHESVWKALADDADPSLASIGARGRELKRARIAADYQNPFPDDLDLKVRDAVIGAHFVIDTLRRLG